MSIHCEWCVPFSDDQKRAEKATGARNETCLIHFPRLICPTICQPMKMQHNHVTQKEILFFFSENGKNDKEHWTFYVVKSHLNLNSIIETFPCTFIFMQEWSKKWTFEISIIQTQLYLMKVAILCHISTNAITQMLLKTFWETFSIMIKNKDYFYLCKSAMHIFQTSNHWSDSFQRTSTVWTWC